MADDMQCGEIPSIDGEFEKGHPVDALGDLGKKLTKVLIAVFRDVIFRYCLAFQVS